MKLELCSWLLELGAPRRSRAPDSFMAIVFPPFWAILRWLVVRAFLALAVALQAGFMAFGTFRFALPAVVPAHLNLDVYHLHPPFLALACQLDLQALSEPILIAGRRVWSVF